MFVGAVVWRGIVYAILMGIAKCATGAWLIFMIPRNKFIGKLRHRMKDSMKDGMIKRTLYLFSFQSEKNIEGKTTTPTTSTAEAIVDSGTSTPDSLVVQPAVEPTVEPQEVTYNEGPTDHDHSSAVPHRNYYPSLLLALAMTTRGEIGFLVAAIAQSTGILMPQEVYLVVVWAIVLCTLIGPIGVGAIVRKIRKIQKEKGDAVGMEEILGRWGHATIESRSFEPR
jgi:hypothetical protein